MRTGKPAVMNPVEEQVLDVSVIIFFLGACVLLLFTSPAAFSQADRTEQAREILEEGGYQQDAPNFGEQANKESREASPSSSTDSDSGSSDRRGSDNWFNSLDFSIFATLLRALMWLILAGLIGALVYLVVYLIWTRNVEEEDDTSVSKLEEEDEDEPSMDRTGMKETLEDADELAEQGRFTDAIRCMFQDAARRIERDVGVALKKSDTNHEYVERIQSTDVQELCRVLVRAVDRYYYGGRTCDETAYQTCRDVWKQVQSQAG